MTLMLFFEYSLELWMNDHGEEPLLPGLTDFSQMQMFWIRGAHQFCEMTEIDLEDFHTPNKYRVLGSMMLSDEFAKEFNCPKGSPMNPVQTCSVGSLWPTNLTSGIRTLPRKNTIINEGNHGKELEATMITMAFGFLGLIISIY